MHTESLDPRRLLATGLDPSFADNGTRTFPATFKPKADAANSVESGDKGALFVAGSDGDAYYVAKLDRNGKPITKFGTNGYARVPFEPDRLAYDATSGTLYVAGNDAVAGTDGNGVLYTPSNETRVVRLRPTGTLDNAFGDAGVFAYRLPEPAGEDTLARVSVETINPLPDGSVLLGVDRANRWRSGSADQDLVLLKLRPDGTPDPRYGKGGVAQLVTGYFEPNYATGATKRAHGYRGVFSDVQVDANGGANVVLRYVDGTRYYREDYPNVDLPLVGQFFVKSRVVTAGGVVDRARSHSWKLADNASDQTGVSFTYAGADGRRVYAALSVFKGGPEEPFYEYLYSLTPDKKPAKRLLVPPNDGDFISSLTRSASGTYIMTDSDKHVSRLRSDFTTDRTFGVRGVATATGTFYGFESPSVYADDLGRALVFEYQRPDYVLVRLD